MRRAASGLGRRASTTGSWTERDFTSYRSPERYRAVESDGSAPISRAPFRTDTMRSLDANLEIIGVFWCRDTKMAAGATGVRNVYSTDCH